VPLGPCGVAIGSRQGDTDILPPSGPRTVHPYYARIWLRSLTEGYATELGPTGLLVSLALLQHSDPYTGDCYPSNRTIGRCTTLKEDAVRMGIKAVEQAGVATVNRRAGKGSTYRLMPVEAASGIRRDRDYSRPPDIAGGRTKPPGYVGGCPRPDRAPPPDQIGGLYEGEPCEGFQEENQVPTPAAGGALRCSKPNSLDEVLAHARERAIPEAAARRFFEHFEARRWQGPRRELLEDWRERLEQWAEEDLRRRRPASTASRPERKGRLTPAEFVDFAKRRRTGTDAV
jgi:hypothetical protein